MGFPQFLNPNFGLGQDVRFVTTVVQIYTKWKLIWDFFRFPVYFSLIMSNSVKFWPKSDIPVVVFPWSFLFTTFIITRDVRVGFKVGQVFHKGDKSCFFRSYFSSFLPKCIEIWSKSPRILSHLDLLLAKCDIPANKHIDFFATFYLWNPECLHKNLYILINFLNVILILMVLDLFRTWISTYTTRSKKTKTKQKRNIVKVDFLLFIFIKMHFIICQIKHNWMNFMMVKIVSKNILQ